MIAPHGPVRVNWSTRPGASWFAAVAGQRAPVQFFLERAVKTLAGHLHPPEAHRRLAEGDPALQVQLDKLLAVDHQRAPIRPPTDGDSVYLVGGFNNRALGEGVGADGGDDEGGEF